MLAELSCEVSSGSDRNEFTFTGRIGTLCLKMVKVWVKKNCKRHSVSWRRDLLASLKGKWMGKLALAVESSRLAKVARFACNGRTDNVRFWESNWGLNNQVSVIVVIRFDN